MKSYLIYLIGACVLIVLGYCNWFVMSYCEVSIFVGAGILFTICIDKYFEEEK
jgi:hypothetical protein